MIGGAALILEHLRTPWGDRACSVPLGSSSTVHGHNRFSFDNAHGGWEYPAVWTVAETAQAMPGDGAYVVLPAVLFRSAITLRARLK
jgi:putative oxidoreductase